MITDGLDGKMKLVAMLAACTAALACGGCSSKPPEVHPIWPPPPSPARVAHRLNVRVASDLARPGFFRKIIHSIVGEDSLTLLRPAGVAVEGDRLLYVADQERQGVVVFGLDSWQSRLIDRVGEVYLVSPVGVAACGKTFAVSDSKLNRVYVLTPEGEMVRTVEPEGGFSRPTGLAYDRRNALLYVVDTLAHEVCVFDLDSGRLVRRFGSPGTGVGQLNHPTHIFLDGKGRAYVSDSMNARVQVFDSEGKYLFHIGSLGDASGHLAVPKGVAVDSVGHVYIVDSYFNTIQIFSQNGTFLMGLGGSGQGSGRFDIPTGLTIDSRDRIYVCDSFNNRIQVLEYVGGGND